jgi:hypothetical protein
MIVEVSEPETRLLFPGKLGRRMYEYWLHEINQQHSPEMTTALQPKPAAE